MKVLREVYGKRRAASTATEYAGWSRDALVRRLCALEGDGPAPKRASRRPAAEIDHDAYPTRHVALRIAYLGWDYSGLASQQSYKPDGAAPPATRHVTTVEDVLFDALMRCKLIRCPRSCAYSRCGRTDAGVSSSGQVVALTLRSSQRRISAHGGDAHALDLPLVSTLNRALPPDVRVLAAAPAPAGFNARFDCRGRTYRYFFAARGLDLAAMAAGAARLVGAHDFVNFARRDPSGRATVTTRQLFRFEIAPHAAAPGWCVAEVHGSSFLYNQVRCMMAVLLRVGRGLEDVSVVDRMLDVAATPTVAPYDLADENPLVLAACHYDAPLAWSSMGDTWLPSLQYLSSSVLFARALVARDVQDAVERDAFAPVDPFFDGRRSYVPLGLPPGA